MTELVSKFGTDAGFQTLLSTGTIPASALASAPTAAPSVPKVSGTGIDTSLFTSLANSATASSLLTQLSTQNLGTIASTISQSQLTQLVAKFGADPAFQTLLSTGAIPVSAIAAVVTTALPKVPTVSGTGIDASLFTNLANSTTASSLLTLLSTQNLGTIASSISQSQLAQLVSKFGSDPNFQTLLATGSIPASAFGSTNKALLINSAVNAESSSVKNIDLQLVGTANEFLATN